MCLLALSACAGAPSTPAASPTALPPAAWTVGDAQGVELIFAHEVPATGLGLAINDRLRRAADVVHEV